MDSARPGTGSFSSFSYSKLKVREADVESGVHDGLQVEHAAAAVDRLAVRGGAADVLEMEVGLHTMVGRPVSRAYSNAWRRQ